MRIEGVLFDLDQTLVDSRLAEISRRTRRWLEVYEMISRLKPFPGIPELLEDVGRSGTRICVVTASPEAYCTRVIAHWNLAVEYKVCYHDTSRLKPFPDPLLRGLQQMQVSPKDALAVGDSPEDVLSANAAGISSVAAMWGASDQDDLLAAGPTFTCQTVSDLRALIFGA